MGKALLQGLLFMLGFGFCQLSSAQSLAAKDVLLLTDDDGTVLELTWALTLPTFNAQIVFATVHQGFSGGDSYGLFNLYTREWSPPAAFRYERIMRLTTQAAGGARFQRPDLVWAQDARQRRRQLLALTEIVHGSGAERIHSVYELSPARTATPIEFKLAGPALARQLAEGETICGNGSYDFSTFPFRFTYAINAEGRRPCQPLHGYFSGVYKLEGTTITLAAADRTAPSENYR